MFCLYFIVQLFSLSPNFLIGKVSFPRPNQYMQKIQTLGMRGRCLAADARWQIRPRFVDLGNRARRMAANRAIPATPLLCRPLPEYWKSNTSVLFCSQVGNTNDVRGNQEFQRPLKTYRTSCY